LLFGLGRWIQEFLKNRENQVMLDDQKSMIFLLKSGVPQGSVLGTILFLIYISDISVGLSVEPLDYVDATKAIKRIEKEEDAEELKKDTLLILSSVHHSLLINHKIFDIYLTTKAFRANAPSSVVFHFQDITQLYNWGKENNMEFNKGKFVVLRYGKDS